MSKKILITGAYGHLGNALCKILINRYNVTPTSSRPMNAIHSYRNTITLDVTVKRNVEQAIRTIQPDIIINCAAFTGVDDSETNRNKARLINVVGLQNLIQASKHNTYIVQISSDYVFDGDAGPYSEQDHTHPINYYGKTKLEAENILRGSRRKFLIIRTNVIYSEDILLKGNFFGWIYKSLGNNKRIFVVNDQTSNPTYVLHLAQAIFQCIILNMEGVYHYGGNDHITRLEFALFICRYFKLDKQLITSIDTEQLKKNCPSYIANRPKHSGLNTTKIEEHIGLTTYPTEYSFDILKKNLK